MTLRAKLLAAQAPLVVALVVFGYAATSTLTALGGGPELILRDNYRSVVAAGRMTEALDQLQANALAAAAGRPVDDASTAAARARLETELGVQEHNITEPGEADATRRLRAAWTAYARAFDAHAASPRGGERGARYLDVLSPAAQAVRTAANEVLSLNQDAMERKADAARRAAARNVEKARELGAEVVRLKSEDPAAAILDFARSHRVSDVIVGRTAQPRWRSLARRTVVQRLVDEGDGLDVHVVSFEGEGAPA